MHPSSTDSALNGPRIVDSIRNSRRISAWWWPPADYRTYRRFSAAAVESRHLSSAGASTQDSDALEYCIAPSHVHRNVD